MSFDIFLSKMRSPVFSKTVGWSILAGLVILDAVLDVLFAEGKGLESVFWEPIARSIGVSNPLFLVPLVLIAFFVCVKILALVVGKIDKIPMAEELMLSILVVVYGVFDLLLIFSYLSGVQLFRSQLQLIPVLIVIGIAYGWWAENRLKKRK